MTAEAIAQALDYAARGWPVLPLHWPTEGGCSCGDDCGRNAGKHPLASAVPRGKHDATTDAATINDWWARWPDANIGLVMGDGLLALDVDPRHGGEETLRDLERALGGLPDTVTALTGGGGQHLIFAAPQDFRSKSGALGPGLDVKCAGGYIVAPPSRHVSGRCYEWEAGHGPDEIALASLPPAIAARLREDRRRTVEEVGERIPEGQRHDALVSLAGTMRRRGMTAEEIGAALLAVNERRCDPPLPEAEVEGVAISVSRYPPDTHPPDVAGTVPPSISTPDMAESAPATLADVEDAFGSWLLMPDMGALHFALAVVAGHRLVGDPLWGLLVAPPSGTKTEIIRSLEAVPGVYPLSELTARTFASGLEGGRRESSLLPRLSDHVLTLKDFGTVLTMHREERQAVLSQLREIYDGRFDKSWGTGKELHWRGRLGFLAGVTPIIDLHHAVHQVLGERLVLYRMDQPDRRDMAKRALRGRGREEEMRRELRDVVARFMSSLVYEKPPALPFVFEERLAALADFTSRARSGVVRERYNRDLSLAPEPEAPARLAKQLAGLAVGRALLRAATDVENGDFAFVYRVALDCLPVVRLQVVDALEGANDYLTTSQVAAHIGYPTTTARRTLEDLAALRIVTIRKAEKSGQADNWQLSEEARGLLGIATGALSAEPGTDTRGETFPATSEGRA